MILLDFLLLALGIYFVYKVVFELIIPIFRTTQKIRQQFGNMHQHMNDQMNNPQNNFSRQTKPPAPEKNKSTKAGDYIDFEEVK